MPVDEGGAPSLTGRAIALEIPLSHLNLGSAESRAAGPPRYRMAAPGPCDPVKSALSFKVFRTWQG